MKGYKEIRKEITANNAKIAELEATADKLLKKAESAAAATWGERVEIHKSITEEEENEAGKLYTRAKELESVNTILQENEKAAFCEYVTPIIKDIMQKYNGKQYGTKTADKIREAAKDAGIGFYFTGYQSKDTIKAYSLAEDGYKYSSSVEVTIYARDTEGKRAEFISVKNTIQDFSNIVFDSFYNYTEEPESKREELKKAYADFEKLVNLAKEAESKLNSLMPENSKRFSVIGHLSPWTKIY